MKKVLSSMSAALFLILIFGIGVQNLCTFLPELKKTIKEERLEPSKGGSQLEDLYRTSFWEYDNWINLYGLTQRGLDRQMIGDVRFVKLESGLMDYVTNEEDVIPFAEELVELKERLDQRELPFLYVQMPSREEMKHPLNGSLLKTNAYYEQINEVIRPAGVVCMDEQEILNLEGAPAREEYYFKNDIHTTTAGEIWTANCIAKKLQNVWGISIPGLIQLEDERFEKKTYFLKGNLAQSTGVCYNGIDRFEELIPKEEGAYRVSDLRGQWSVEGDFDEVLMNGYSNNVKTSEDELHTYWVTDYLRYGSEGYHIENQNRQDTSLLVICDSLCYRALSYMAMECANITVLDPRFYADDTDLVELALKQKTYDAVIYLHGTFYTTDYSMFGRGKFESVVQGEGE